MDRNNNETKVKVDSNSNSQDPLIKTQNRESNPQVNENENSLVAGRDEAGNLKGSHRVPTVITVWCLLSLIHPILTHVFDFVSDIRLVIDYFENQKTVEASFTLAFTILQATACTWISFLMHNPKSGEVPGAKEDEDETEANRVEKMAKITVRYSIVLMLQRVLPLCRLRKLYYAFKLRGSQQKENKVLVNHYYLKMLQEDRDSAVLKVVDSFMQSAPQLILQLFFLLTQDSAISEPMWSKIVSGCVTLFALGKTMKNYHCAIRLAQPDKAVIGEIGGALLLLWHLGTIAARILVIGIAARSWLSYTILACAINWIGWTIWIYANENVVSILHWKKTDAVSPLQTKREKVRNLFLASVLAIVYTFTFINLGNRRTFVRNSLYYVTCLLQNGTVFVLWFMLTNLTIENILLPQVLLVISVIFFLTGIGAMVTYYMLFHPTLPSGCCNFNTSDYVTFSML